MEIAKILFDEVKDSLEKHSEPPGAWTKKCLSIAVLAAGLFLIIDNLFALSSLLFLLEGTSIDCEELHNSGLWSFSMTAALGVAPLVVGLKNLRRISRGYPEATPLLPGHTIAK